ncbi:hypothetical protein HBH56_144260 [Parastagonospora nodorum]|nr:hypothetical protein HBH56_144260 [Parastagonospora nodorum]KAH3927537.1 hypothetical protein HBH54_149450 [Parastagonospora nodorum]KAH3947969.1 hypothetical protein HBH53_109490 [Parastagonospora nodorum]KAH3960106.1 hypothetical protein HBH51_193310 [Parastagonospora nodorum]KAH4020500.1 hypothetical protein HBI13_115660 [Parastagonospora nodorum]
MPDESSQPQISYKKICHVRFVMALICAKTRGGAHHSRGSTSSSILNNRSTRFLSAWPKLCGSLERSREWSRSDRRTPLMCVHGRDVAGFSHVFVMQRLHSWISDEAIRRLENSPELFL